MGRGSGRTGTKGQGAGREQDAHLDWSYLGLPNIYTSPCVWTLPQGLGIPGKRHVCWFVQKSDLLPVRETRPPSLLLLYVTSTRTWLCLVKLPPSTSSREPSGKPGCVLWGDGHGKETSCAQFITLSSLGTESQFPQTWSLSHWCSELVSKTRTTTPLPFCLAGCWFLLALTLEEIPFLSDKNTKVNIHIDSRSHTPAGGPMAVGFPKENPDPNQMGQAAAPGHLR